MSSDEDYVDVGIDSVAVPEEAVPARDVNERNGKRVRGKDIVWIEFLRFGSMDDYKNSTIFKELKTEFTMKIAREPGHADIEIYVCKHSRRRNFLPCPLKYKISFLADSDDVLVEANIVHPAHHHEVDPNYGDEGGASFKWTIEQTTFIREKVKNYAKPKAIMLDMIDANLFPGGRTPTSLELNNKIRHVQKLLYGNEQIFTTHELREKIQEFLNVPENDDEAYIAYWNVDDERESEAPRFNIIWTSRKLLKRVHEDLTQDDATYRLLWQGD